MFIRPHGGTYRLAQFLLVEYRSPRLCSSPADLLPGDEIAPRTDKGNA